MITSARGHSSTPHLPDDLKAAILDWICPIPQLILFDSGHRRLTHRDLDDMTDTELKAELARVRLRLLLDERRLYANDWLLERLERLRGFVDEQH